MTTPSIYDAPIMEREVVIVIPARYASTRLPGKMLLAETGKPMIQHVYENAKDAGASRVIVATDDARILQTVEQFGGHALMTSPHHQSGTERVAEAAESLGENFDGIIINLQGDEPMLPSGAINALIELQRIHNPFMSTLVSRFQPHLHAGPGSPLDPSAVKVVLTAGPRVRQALYFSRSLIPYTPASSQSVATPQDYYLHSGIYAFTRASLRAFVRLPHSMLEKREGLEQLRALEHGKVILALEIEAATPGIDTPADYATFLSNMKK